jgi:Holliday junction DNA helicase RuvB
MTPGPPRRGAEVGPFPPYDEAGRDTTYGGAGRDTTYGGPGRAGEPGYDAGETGEAGSGDEYGDGSYDATARVVDPTLEGTFDADDERRVEAALRPKRLAEIAGQTRVREQLGLVLEAARRRGTPPDHMLLSGPPGLGKTTLAMIVAAELEAPIRVTSGPAIQHAATWPRSCPA